MQLDDLETWVREHRDQLEAVGEVGFGRGPADRDKRSAHLSVEGEGVSLELLVWESGEAELNGLVDGTTDLEHLEFEGPEEFRAVLRLFLQKIEAAGRRQE